MYQNIGKTELGLKRIRNAMLKSINNKLHSEDTATIENIFDDETHIIDRDVHVKEWAEMFCDHMYFDGDFEIITYDYVLHKHMTLPVAISYGNPRIGGGSYRTITYN